MSLPYGQHSLDEDDVEAVVRALGSDRITQGSLVREFETALCDTFGCEHAVVVSHGTMALKLAYQALEVRPGDRVITSPNTFVATANGFLYQGGRPQFLDIHPNTYNLSVEELRKQLRTADTEDLVGITAVHFAGNPCRMEAIHEIAREHGLFVLEDACHAPGATWTDSRGTRHEIGSCSRSDAAVLSFHPVKHFTTGEGGALLTNREELAERVRRLRTHGITKNSEELTRHDGPWYYEMKSLGENGRITDFQCALGLQQLQKFGEFLERRRELAKRYDHAFADLEPVNTQTVQPEAEHAYHLYVILAKNRDELFQHLQENEVQPQVHYIPVYRQPYYREQFDISPGSFPNTEQYYGRAITLPLFPDMSEQQQDRVVQTVKRFYENR